MITTIKGVKVDAISCSVPNHCVSVFEYCNGLINEKEAKRLAKNTGFENLRISGNNVTTSDFCFKAAEQIIRDEAFDKNSIDAIIFVSQTPDYYLPATSHELQHRLRLSENILCFDINEGCSGYVNGLYLATLLVSSRQCRKVLLLAGDTISKLTSPNDRATRTIFGDAGTATVVSQGEMDINFNIQTFGDRFKAIMVPNSRHRIEVDSTDVIEHLNLDGMGIMNFTLDEVPKNIEQLIDYSCMQVEDVTLYACHQANKLILKSLSERLKINENKIPFVAGEIGNTSSASIPLLLSGLSSDKDKLLKVCCAGFGVGLSVATCIFDFSKTRFYETVKL